MRFTGTVTGFSAILAAIISMGFAQQKTFAAKCPCDIYIAGGTPCVAAHSMVRALYSTYNGPLYQVRRTSDNKLQDIGVLTPGGFVNAAVQDTFLNGKPGTISKIYDQSPKGNHLLVTPPGGWMTNGGKEANAADAKIKVNGYTAYGVYINAGDGYRNNKTTGVATGNAAEGMYMVCSGTHFNDWCCFDYGNAQTSMTDDGNATMESIYFGSSKQVGTTPGHGSGNGPWVMNDCENGLQAGVDSSAGGTKGVWAGNTTITANYVTGTLKSTNSNFWEIRGGDANSGKLKTMYSGRQYPGWYPKKLEGAIILGTGGDNSNTSIGTFFEGAMTSGCPSDTVEDSVQASIIAAGFGSSVTSTIWHGASDAATAPMVKVNYNPSRVNAVISYTVRDAGHVSMNIFDQRGRRIAAIVDGVIPAGRHEAVWNTKGAPAGVYIWKIAIDGRDGDAGKIIVGK